jgi:hypothetical protein
VHGVRLATEPELIEVVGLKAMKAVKQYFADQALLEAANAQEPQDDSAEDGEVNDMPPDVTIEEIDIGNHQSSDEPRDQG